MHSTSKRPMQKISIKTLLSLMMTFIMVALAVPLTLIVSSENTEIKFLKQEKSGVEIIPLLQQVNILLAEHRGTANRFLNGNQQVLPTLKELEIQIDAALNDVIKQCEKQANNLTIPYQKIQHIQSDWQLLKENYSKMAKADSFKRHKDLIANMMELQRDIADISHLSLDNQLSTYYLMNNIVKTMPYLMENLGQVRGFGSGLAAQHYASENEKIELAELSNSARLALQSMSFELKRIFINLPFFQKELNQKLIHSEQVTEKLLLLSEQEIINKKAISLPDDIFYAQATDAINHIMELYVPVVKKLTDDLDKRIKELLFKRYMISTAFFILLATIFGFISLIINRINTQLQHAISCFEKINLEQYDYPITITYQDEIGQLLQSLQIMRNRLANNVEQLKTTVNRLKQAQRIAQMGDWEWNIAEQQLSCSEETHVIFDIYPDNIAETYHRLLNYESFLNYTVASDQLKLKSVMNQALQQAGSYSVEYRIRTLNGQFKVINQCMETLTNEQGNIISIVGTLQDVTMQREMEYKARLTAQVFEHIGEAIMVTNEENKIILVNHAFSEITGFTKEEVIGKDPNILKSGKHDQSFYQAMWEQINSQGLWKGELWNFRKDKSLYPESLTISTIKNSAGEIINYVGIAFDITEQKKIHDEISYLAHYDSLTGLINRVEFRNKFDNELEKSQHNNNQFAILFIDLDGFKAINDYFGHDKGDEVLQITAKRLKHCVRKNDIVARLGGDEFIVLLPEIKEQGHVIAITEKIIDHLNQSLRDTRKSLIVTPSIGIAIYPGDGLNYEELLNRADKAMYIAKARGRNQYALVAE